MVVIDRQKCIGCGQCIRDCFGFNLQMEENKAQVIGQCFQCGHCVAVCPVNAFQITDYPEEDIEEYGSEEEIAPEQLLHTIKLRRSVRSYQHKPVEQEVLRRILQAGRFAPTAGNAQDVSYIVIQKELPQIIPMVWQGFRLLNEQCRREDPEGSGSRLWDRMLEKYEKDPQNQDHLFFGAPVLLIVTAREKVNGWLAAANIELMAHAQGLGCLYSGFIERAIRSNEELSGLLGLDEKNSCTCMLLGYPGVTYRRTAPRKELQVTWK